MDVGAFQDHPFNARAIKLSVRTRRYENLCSVRKELRGATLVRLDMRGFVAYDTVIAAAHGRQRERVRSRPVKDKIDVAIRLKDLANPIARPRGMDILSVGRTTSIARINEGSQRFGTKPCRIVAGKVVTGFHAADTLREFWMRQAVDTLPCLLGNR